MGKAIETKMRSYEKRLEMRDERIKELETNVKVDKHNLKALNEHVEELEANEKEMLEEIKQLHKDVDDRIKHEEKLEAQLVDWKDAHRNMQFKYDELKKKLLSEKEVNLNIEALKYYIKKLKKSVECEDIINQYEELLKKIAFYLDSEVGSSSEVKRLAKNVNDLCPKGWAWCIGDCDNNPKDDCPNCDMEEFKFKK